MTETPRRLGGGLHGRNHKCLGGGLHDRNHKVFRWRVT